MRIVILEDDPLIALDLQVIVESCGHEVVRMCTTLADMLPGVDDETDFALLDVDLPDGKSYDVATRLDRNHVPFAFVSGSRQGELPEHLRHARFVAKPYSAAAIRNTLNCEHRLAS